MSHIEMMKSWLEALEHLKHNAEKSGANMGLALVVAEEAIDTLRTAIEQAEKQEPVPNASAWFALVMNAAAEIEDASHCLRDEDAKRIAISGAKYYRDAAKALYTTPPAAPVQEECVVCGDKVRVIPRPWVGLDADEKLRVRLAVGYSQFMTAGEYAEKVQDATEAKLRELNGGRA